MTYMYIKLQPNDSDFCYMELWPFVWGVDNKLSQLHTPLLNNLLSGLRLDYIWNSLLSASLSSINI